MTIIKKGGKRQIRKNFNEAELQSDSWRRSFHDIGDSFNLSDKTLNALQWLRNRYNAPLYVTSTARLPLHNHEIGGVATSQHLEQMNPPLDGLIVRAIDFKASDKVLDKIKDDLLKRDLWQKLLSKGIKGVGIYNDFIHIDSRRGKVAFWDNRKK